MPKKPSSSNKNFVTMEQHICIVCAQPYDTGSILMDTKVRDRFDMHTITGQGLCPEHQKLLNEGFVALVGVDLEKSQLSGNTIKQENAYRTGDILHVKREALRGILNVPVPDDLPMMFVDPQVIEAIQKMTQPEGE